VTELFATLPEKEGSSKTKELPMLAAKLALIEPTLSTSEVVE
jgi:hypothetical protein